MIEIMKTVREQITLKEPAYKQVGGGLAKVHPDGRMEILTRSSERHPDKLNMSMVYPDLRDISEVMASPEATQEQWNMLATSFKKQWEEGITITKKITDA